MAQAADEAGIQFRILNSRKGPAVRATRAQADRVLYRKAIRGRLENQPRLRIFQQAVDDLLIEGDHVSGVVTQIGLKFSARAVVLTTGTFLAGLIHVGLRNYQAGRAGDPPAVRLAQRLRELKLPVGRLKTGTPPRIDGRSIDFSVMTEQPGDDAGSGIFISRRPRSASAAVAVLDHAYQRAHPRHHSRRARPLADVYRRDRGRRPALLPFDRRQNHALRATRPRTRSSSSPRA